MPYGTVNLRHGVPEGETPITCTAGVATFIVEFGALSRLTGDPVYEDTAIRALNSLWQHRTELQRRSSKVLEKRSIKSLLWVGNLYQSSTTLGLEPVSIVHYTRPGSSIKRPTPN